MSFFSLGAMREVSIGDRAELEPVIRALEPCSCEMNFLNIFTWSHVYETKFQIAGNLPWVWFRTVDILLFPGGYAKNLWPEPGRLAEVSAVLRGNGYSGLISQVPEEYFGAFPDWKNDFRAEQVSVDVGEYLYRVDKLAGLHGSKLSKKKNLVSQFLRNAPDCEVVPFGKERIADCLALSHNWAEEHGDTGSVLKEEDALLRTYRYAEELGVEGVCVYTGGKLAAFTLCTRLNSNTFDEHYEKSDSSLKGAAQMVNRATMESMLGKYEYVNREQDLGIEGLRHAKTSYDPESVLRNWNLIPL